jgi:hypothetical protein
MRLLAGTALASATPMGEKCTQLWATSADVVACSIAENGHLIHPPFFGDCVERAQGRQATVAHQIR